MVMLARYVIKNTDLIISMPSDFSSYLQGQDQKPPGAFPRLWPMVPKVGEGQLAEEGREEDLGGQGTWGTRVAPRGGGWGSWLQEGG